MLNLTTRCEGAFIGHAIASQYDPSIYMALNVSDSLVACQKFDGPDILSRHLYLYHTKKCEIGDTTKYIYQEAIKRIGTRKTPTLESFRFDQATIDELVRLAHDKCNGLTAGCGPVHRSYPLALCQLISDEDLFEYSMLEAKLTHHSPMAGQAAGIVNLICRSLLRNTAWEDAVSTAFTTPRLHEDIQQVCLRHRRWTSFDSEANAAYVPVALTAALHHVSISKNAPDAIIKADGKDKYYCLPIVGILAGIRWGMPVETFKNNIDDQKLKTVREAASKLISMWKTTDGVGQIFA